MCHIIHDPCIIYDVYAVVHSCSIMVLDLHTSCKNGLPWCLGFQKGKDHIKFHLVWIGFHWNKKMLSNQLYLNNATSLKEKEALLINESIIL